MRTSRVLFVTAVGLLLLTGCQDPEGSAARKAIRDTHAGEVQKIVRDDYQRHVVGVRRAAERLAPGFVVEDPAERERGMRVALKALTAPERARVAIGELVVSPMSYIAAVGRDGIVIARDAVPDQMRGLDFGERYPVVRAALERGEPGYALGESTADNGEPTYTMMFVHPSTREGQVVGAIVVGIPLWRMAQRLSRQIRLDHASEQDLILWVYVYNEDRDFHHGTPGVIDALVPDGAARRAGLERSPGGFTEQTQILGRWYGYGVLPTPLIGPNAGVVIFRSDPPK